MQQHYTLGRNFYSSLNNTTKTTVRKRFKGEKHVWTAKEKELITKYRKGQIWKTL